MNIDIKHWNTGEVIFSHDEENNSIKITLEKAVELKIYLNYANLNDANLNDANLNDANLIGVIGNKIEIKTMLIDEWAVVFNCNLKVLAIGCEQHLFDEWTNFTDKQICKMDKKALKWWKKWKKFIFTAIELSEDEI